MENPLDKPRNPENFMQDIEDLARDLAYGVLMGEWRSRHVINDSPNYRQPGVWFYQDTSTALQDQYKKKWVTPKNAPEFDAISAFGFMEREILGKTAQNEDSIRYTLTRMAFDLLQKPAQSPSIFISYRRKESSTFALLVEARLRMAGADPKRIFIDKTIPIGDEWESHLVERLTSCEVFICMVGKTAFEDGSWLQREIEILRSENPTAIILPILHNGVTMSDPIVERFFGSVQSATVKEESALEYENAINHILNRLGYETYWPSPTSPFSGLGTD
jgi:hypothetical protein